MPSCYGIESGGLLYNTLIGILFSDKRNQRMLRQGDRSKQWHQVNEIQVAKCDVFHSGIFCNKLTRAPECTACGGPGALDTAVPPRQ